MIQNFTPRTSDFNRWNKYSVSSRALEVEREATLKALDKLLNEFGYGGSAHA